MTDDDKAAAMTKMSASNDQMMSAMSGLGNKLGANINAITEAIPDNIEDVGKRWAMKNGEILKDYGCSASCVD